MVVKGMIVPCYVIHLGTDFDNRKSLQSIGLNPIGFKGVNGKRDEFLKYQEYIDPDCFASCPKTVIGCGLSHILLAEKLYEEGHDVALVLEDDAYPKVVHFDFESIIKSVPSDWEIIKLHCDTHCKDGSYVTEFGSNAAYIINRKGMFKLKNLKVKFHIDYQLVKLSDIIVYKSQTNLFWADESSSSNRQRGKGHWFSVFTSKPTSGEKDKDMYLMYPIHRIPGTTIEYTAGTIINCALIFLLIVLYGTVRSYSTSG
jgi:hypothetical protein